MIEAAIALGFIFIGLLLVWLANRFKLGLGEASKTAILLLPIVAYLILAGKVVEFEALGWKTKFREIAAERVIVAATAAKLAINIEAANQPNFFSEAVWAPCRPYYLLTEAAAILPSGQLDARVTLFIATAIRNSIICGKFEALIVVDGERRPIGFFLRENFLEILRIPLVTWSGAPPDASLFDQVASSELGVVLKNPITRAKSEDAIRVFVPWDSDIESTYKILLGADVRVATILDRLGRFGGIITRAAIEARVIEKIIEVRKGDQIPTAPR